jgi:hypothetical protein
MKTDDELNALVAVGLMHWKIDNGVYLNSHRKRRYAITEFKPLSNQKQFEEVANKLKGMDYEMRIAQLPAKTESQEVSFIKYGESFTGRGDTIARAGTIAALKAYQLI